MMGNTLSSSIAVVGAGIVGLSVAVQLQRRGYHVTVIDRDAPMAGCSSGNAGYLSEANIFAPAAPDMLRQLPRLLLADDGPLVIKPSYMPKMLAWGRHALGAVPAGRRQAITQTLAAMTVQAYSALAKMAGHTGAAHLLSRDGGLVAFKNAGALERKCEQLAVWQRHGIAVHRLSGAELRALEPALAPTMVGGLHFQNSGRCSDPRQLGLLYAQHLQAHGAAIVRDRVQQLQPQPGGAVRLRCDSGERSFAQVVVCAGFWSGALLQPFFRAIPLVSERGYHLMLPRPGVRLTRPVVFGEPHFAATPMDQGLRLAGTAEFASADAGPNLERAHMLLRLAQDYLLELDGTDAVPWMGVRPSLPDGLPAIGQVPAHPAIHYAFGHAHNGLTLSAVTAECLAAQLSATPAPMDLAALDLGRFGGRRTPSLPAASSSISSY